MGRKEFELTQHDNPYKVMLCGWWCFFQWALGNDDDADDVKGDWLISDLRLAATVVTGSRV